MTRQTRKRRDADQGRALTPALTPAREHTLTAARIATIQRELDAIPPAPDVSVGQVWRSVARWPQLLRLRAIKILVNKLTADLAYRSLLLIDKLAVTDDSHAARANDDMLRLDPTDPQDQQTLQGLLDLWAHLPAHAQVDSDRDFERFARITAGLQIMMEAAPPQAADSWAFDSGAEYSRLLSQVGLLPTSAMTAHAFEAGAEHFFQVKISQFDGSGAVTMDSNRLYWSAPSTNPVSVPLASAAVEAAPAADGHALAIAS